ncbi:EAL domain-containing protein [Rhodoferax sp.]|uniref:EAL domain-containing protein n=1 Tax=Rhodoferax sp. TaxID=50421 RepID=UPI00342EC116
MLTVDLAVTHTKLEVEINSATEYEARTVYGFMMATRRIYQQQFVDSKLPINVDTIGFLPAHSFSRISKDFANWNQNGIVFNNVTDIARNPVNQADRFELEDMAFFRSQPAAKERMRKIVSDQGVGYLLYTAPILIESACLLCHGQRAVAPASIRDAYATGYDYKVGDLRGVVSIRVPTATYDARLFRVWSGQLVKSLLSYLLLFLVIGFLLDRLVTRRLVRLQRAANRITEGHYDTRLPTREGNASDEIHQLAHTFNDMATAIETRDQSLNKLLQAVEQSPESVIITDVHGTIEYVNATLVNKSGFSREDLLGSRAQVFQRSEGTGEQDPLHPLWEALDQGQWWQGELHCMHKDGSQHPELVSVSPVRNRDGKISHYLMVRQDLTEKKRTEAQIQHMAYFDALTGLPNHTLLMDRLAQAANVGRRMGHQAALLIVNVDRFKYVNDARGHAMGNQLLKAVAQRLQSSLRDGDTLARMAADEFAVLLPDLTHDDEHASRHTLSVAEKIHETLRAPLAAQGELTTVTVSIGICLFPVQSARDVEESPDDILLRADNALHRAKEAGGNQTALFASDMAELAQRRFALERELRLAIPAGELRLYLQPQWHAQGALAGAEVLVRWQHPVHGLISPAVFIPVAEASDLIVDVGVWVFTQACQLLAQQATASYPLRLSVNLSPRHFRKADFVFWLQKLMADIGVNPTQLMLEVTEGLMIDNFNDVVTKMQQLTAMGLRFSLDDFGTGYSSLGYLKRLPIHELKIDKSFVQDAPHNSDDAMLVETVLEVARRMHLEVVAEGIETQEQANFLNSRAHLVHQGYLYGRPEPAAVWLARWAKTGTMRQLQDSPK